MTVDRSVVTMVFMLVTTVIVLVHAKDVTTLEYDDLLPANETTARHRVDTGTANLFALTDKIGRSKKYVEEIHSPAGDHRQGRMSLQAELPSSKAKREQTLRSILAARRRQILNHRPIEARNPSRTPRPSEAGLKDSPDVLEAQETRHGMYVTVSGSEKAEQSVEEEPLESSRKNVAETSKSGEAGNEFVSRDVEGKPAAEVSGPRKPSNESFGVPSPGNTRSNYSIGHRNSSSNAFSPTTLSPKETEARKRNIVSMPESLYNYFRPVESNIPVEDMSQFLYFGQKIQPETQNSTENSSVDATPTPTPTPATVASSRRRYSMKRFGTTPVPVPQPEEIVNEEMNIAVDRQVVEKNKVSKLKNAFRSPEAGLYYRKSRPTDPTIASNIIATIDAGRNATGDDNPSAHAVAQEQLRHGRGSAVHAAHVLAETRNATNSTQIPDRQAISANASKPSEESEIGFRDRVAETSGDSALNRVDQSTTKKNSSNYSPTFDPRSQDVEDNAASSSASEMYGDHTEQRIRRVDVYSSFDLARKNDGALGDQARAASGRESNNIETSTSRDKIGRSTTEPFRIGWTSPETSTLRIIVTDGSLEERYTVKPVDSTEKRVRSGASGDVPTTRNDLRTASTSGVSVNGGGIDTSTTTATAVIEVPTTTTTTTTTRSKPRHRELKHHRIVTGKDKGANEGNRDREQHRHQEQQQQHVYAYTITNVTRLLRNYTGPGLSREEQGGPGTTEITTGSALRRQPLPSPPPPPPPSLLQLPRAGSGIEADRAPAELSAGTTVEAVAAGGASVGLALVGERQRKVVTVARQTEEQPVNGGPQQQLTVNKSSPREVTSSRGAVRWNNTRTRNTDLEGFGDRRFLRKSASAVLNQRIGGGLEEDGGPLVVKRRRPPNGQTTGSARRVKGGKVLVNGSEKKGSEIERVTDDAEVGPVNNMTTVGIVAGNMTVADSVAMEQRTLPSIELIDATTLLPVVNITGRGNFTGPVDSIGGNLQVNTKGQLKGLSPSENESVPASNASVGDSAARNAAENGSGSSTVTVTAAAAVDETTELKETTTTPIPPPVFPVTPRIITETVRAPAEKETFTLQPTEPVSQVTDTKTAAPDSFEVANMDPSEIQKMYRSKNTSAAETTTTPTTVQIEISTMSQDQTTTTVPRKRLSSGERSPEVRGRNLSDNSKDKDDVLPIMHLYNDSDIFNGSGPMNSFSRGSERRMELPVHPKHQVSRTTEKVNGTVTPKTVPNDATGPTRVPVTETTRRDRHEESRGESSTHVPPTGPGRGSANNRTRHRPVYHHAILPEYNVSVYPDELNRTFFETGLISVSPRESVNISEVISKRHDGDVIATQETVAVVSYILATLVVFPIAVGVGLILRRLILRNRKVLEESDTSSEISCRKDALNLENGDFKTSIEKAITKLPRIQHLCHEAEKPPPPSSQESRWEFPRDKLRLQTVLGQGNFGQVWKAEADDLTGHQGTTRLVAVKTVKEGASDREKEDLVRELEIMQQLGSHPNVVTLLGCCTEQEPHYLILEYVMYGKLLAYLRDHRTRQDFYNFSEDSAALTSRDLTVFGYCVARGMEYLASKKIIHRDLAARNVLVDHNKLCKIADFGMSRFANEDGEVIETRHGRNALPIRWMAPESLIYSLFTTKTDVWSFGILMWEIVTLGSTPYPDMTAREVMRNVQNGYRLERPSHCRSELFRVISRCWHADPDRRPEFQTLRRDLAQLLEDNLNGHYVDLESFASECTD